MRSRKQRYLAIAILAAVGSLSSQSQARETEFERVTRLWRQVDPEPKWVSPPNEDVEKTAAMNQACAGTKARLNSVQGRGMPTDYEAAFHANQECRRQAAGEWRDLNDPSYRVWNAWYERDSERVQKAFRGELASPPRAASAGSAASSGNESAGSDAMPSNGSISAVERYWSGGTMETPDHLCDRFACPTGSITVRLTVNDNYRERIVLPGIVSSSEFYFAEPIAAGTKILGADVTRQSDFYHCDVKQLYDVVPAVEKAINVAFPIRVVKVTCLITAKGREAYQTARLEKERSDDLLAHQKDGLPVRSTATTSEPATSVSASAGTVAARNKAAAEAAAAVAPPLRPTVALAAHNPANEASNCLEMITKRDYERRGVSSNMGAVFRNRCPIPVETKWCIGAERCLRGYDNIATMLAKEDHGISYDAPPGVLTERHWGGCRLGFAYRPDLAGTLQYACK